uniref:LisH domain-containing protein n=1 Tax=Thelazia callipaeda TaxID=103827 RepID=A0A158RBL4_THECL
LFSNQVNIVYEVIEYKTVKTETQKEDNSANNVLVTHLFVELTSLDELSFPTSSSARIKYTCLDASTHYLAVGSTTGTIYLFSRFASKHRSRLSSVPIQVVSTKDGPVVKLSISPNEKYLATASKRGSLTITALTGIGQNPTILFSVDSHVSRDENGQPAYVTELCWCKDSSKIYAGDTKGQISRTVINKRSFFRSPSNIIFKTDSEIVQFDLRDDMLLASTMTRCCICNLKTYSCIQVGKKLRRGRLGAVFYTDQQENCMAKNGQSVPQSTDISNDLTAIFASRPNGRLWEANNRGVVYSTHQYRNLKTFCRFPVISFRNNCTIDSVFNGEEIRSIDFGRLSLIRYNNNSFLMTKAGTSFCLIDPTDSHLVLVSTADFLGSVNEYAVNDTDVFLLSSETDYVLNKSAFSWDHKLLEDILNKIILQHYRSQNIHDTLRKLLKETKDNVVIDQAPKLAVHRLNSGIHRVVQTSENSGYEDDFTFRAPSPLRLRSRSSPRTESRNTWKRRSLPLNQLTVQRSDVDNLELQNSEERRKKLLQGAQTLLLNKAKEPTMELVRDGGIESLQTLLDFSNTLVLFDQQVTVSDVIKDLDAAKKFLQLITSYKKIKEEQKQRTMQIDFESLFGRADPLQMLERCIESLPSSVSVNVARLQTVRRTRRGARIVKGIKPLGKKSVLFCRFFTTDLVSKKESVKSEHYIQFSQQHSVEHHNLASNKNLSLNCTETFNGVEKSKHGSLNQTLKIDMRSLEKSYVIEKNFMVVRPIEVTWTMSTEIKADVLADNKISDTILSNDDEEDEGLMQLSEVTITPAALSSSEARNLLEEDSVYCPVCDLHKSVKPSLRHAIIDKVLKLWHYVMIFGPKMCQLRVTVDCFAVGGVPIGMRQWSNLFDYYIAVVDSKNPVKSLCEDCLSFFDFDGHLKNKSSSLQDLIKQKLGTNIEEDDFKKEVQETIRSWDSNLVYQLFFTDDAIPSKRSSLICGDADNNRFDISQEKQNVECPKKFLWLSTLKISQLLLCMRYCEGLETVFQYLKNNKQLVSRLTAEDWQWLFVMKAYELDRACYLMPKEVIADLLTELRISLIEDVGSVLSASFSNSIRNEINNSDGGIEIFIDGNCPCCTLPLKMRVTQDDGYITLFRCGKGLRIIF